jgi:hypothetical protein
MHCWSSERLKSHAQVARLRLGVATAAHEIPFQCIAMLLPPMAQQSLVEAQATLPSGLVLALGEATNDHPGGVGVAKVSAARKTATEQSVIVSRTRGLKRPD